jgi:hypothetical protein
VSVYLVTSGDGSDGNEWYVVSIHSTREAAEKFVNDYNAHRPRWARLELEGIEEWPVDEPFNPANYPNEKKEQA